jgi:hypothetical protein
LAKKSFRLGGGEFEREFIPLDPDLIGREVTLASVEDERDRLMRACMEVEPRLRKSLFSKELSPIEWAEEWNLRESWCLRWAERQLRDQDSQRVIENESRATGRKRKEKPRLNNQDSLGRKQVRRIKKLTNFVITGISLVAEPWLPEPLQFQSEGWRIERHDRRSFKKQVTAEFARALDSYCDKIEKEAELAGFVRTHEKRTEEDFYWLARHHLKGERFADIAHGSAAGPTTDQVRVAVHRLAYRIGFPLRNPKNR